MTTIYHGTPMTPRAALEAMAGRSFCVSYYRPDDDVTVARISDDIMLDNGAFSFWNAAKKEGCEADEANRDWRPFYDWSGARRMPGRWAVIPDVIGAPSQINDGLLNEWPHGPMFGAPVWHMDGPLERLPRLAERYDRVCLGWVGGFHNGNPIPSEKAVGCDAYRRRMDEVAAMLGNCWPKLHMLRGVAVAFDYPFRQRRQHQLGAKWVETRQPDRHDAWRPVARQASLRRPFGRKAA
jgi:hypothetical protein